MLDQIKVIPQKSLLNDDPVILGQWLLGKLIISKIDDTPIISRIVETEAYKAPEDKASHAYGNKLTQRTAPMFEAGGISYVYLCYGIHNMLNVVTGPQGMAHAILIRAIEPLEGLDHIYKRRGQKPLKQIANGPGKLCKALGIDRSHNTMNLCDPQSLIHLGDAPCIKKEDIICSPRVGIDYAEECKDWPWRFRVKSFV